MIDNSTKEQIRLHLRNYCETAGSANRAANTLSISGATISKVLSSKDNDLSEDMWRKLSNAMGMRIDERWKHAETIPGKVFGELFADAQGSASVYAAVAQPGSGKTYTLDRYRKLNPNVFYAKCSRHTSPADLLSFILKSAGRGANHRQVSYMLSEIERLVNRTEMPVIIIDEYEKVKNDTLFTFIDLYNILQYKSGIVMLGTPNFKFRIEQGVANGKICFNEFYSRIGGRFIEVPAASAKDAIAVMRANGIDDQVRINQITNDSNTISKNSVDLRRVERLVHKEKIQEASK